jgi:dTDP-4-dehydrorhamnose reductase
MKTLVTGASGLLGSDLVKTFGREGIPLVKLRRGEGEGFVSADLTTPEGIEKVSGLEWDSVVHTAAMKIPDECETKRAETFKINVEATGKLASLAAARGALFVFISTDFVFPGTNPPYSEEDTPRPLNYYGESKLQAENIVRETCRRHIIFRIPFLYGVSAGLQASAMLWSSVQALNSAKPWGMDDTVIRYPTYTGDTAEAILFLMRKEAGGIFHFSGQDKMTRHTITRAIAEASGKSMANVVRTTSVTPGAAARPEDAHLSIKKILAAGFPEPLPFTERLRILRSEGYI